MEDAAQLAQEFTLSLDNLPGEVQHIIKEIESKEQRSSDIVARIEQRKANLAKHIRTHGALVENPKSEQLSSKLKADYDKVLKIADEKEALATRLWTLVYRHHARLCDEMEKLDPTMLAQAPASGFLTPQPSLAGVTAADLATPTSTENGSLKRKHGSMISTPFSLSSPASGTTTPSASRPGGRTGPQKGSSLLATSTPITAFGSLAEDGSTPPSTPSSVPSRARKGARAGTGARKKEDEQDAGVETGEPTGAEDDEEQDKTLYCTCQRVSFGEMIGCDGEDCRYEWFHLGCVGLTKPLPQTWYCDECKAKQKRRKR